MKFSNRDIIDEKPRVKDKETKGRDKEREVKMISDHGRTPENDFCEQSIPTRRTEHKKAQKYFINDQEESRKRRIIINIPYLNI